jgi:hypothetical protein
MKLPGARQLAGQSVAWLLFMATTGVFAQWPVYSPIPQGHGELKLSMAHLTERLEPCRQLSAEEIAALPPNMRVVEQCPRGRVSAFVELEADGAVLFEGAVRPVGLARGGRTYLQARWSLPAGSYELELRLRDSPREAGFDLVERFSLNLDRGESALLSVGDGKPRLIPGRSGSQAAQEGIQ